MSILDKIKSFSIPDSTFDGIRSLTMHKSDLQDYQRNRDQQIAEQRAQQSPNSVVQAYGSYSPYETRPLYQQAPAPTPAPQPPALQPQQSSNILKMIEMLRSGR